MIRHFVKCMYNKCFTENFAGTQFCSVEQKEFSRTLMSYSSNIYIYNSHMYSTPQSPQSAKYHQVGHYGLLTAKPSSDIQSHIL